MFVRKVSRKNGDIIIRIVENVREGRTVKQKIIKTIGQSKNPETLDILEKIALDEIIQLKNERDPVLPGFEEEFHKPKPRPKTKESQVNVHNLKEETRVITGFDEVFGNLYKQLSFDDFLSQEEQKWNTILKEVTITRLFEPDSKLRSSDLIQTFFNRKLPVQSIYRMMDRLVKYEEDIKAKIFSKSMSLLDQQVDVMFYDVTTLYFESFVSDGLKACGYSKDNKFKETQVMLAMVTNNRGLPLTYHLFPGNMYEGHTLITAIETLTETYKVENVVLVADRAMFNANNLELMEKKKIKYIVAAKLKTLSHELKERFLPLSNPWPAPNDLVWIKDFEVQKERRLIVSYSKKRSLKDNKDRQKLIDRLIKKSQKGKIKTKEVISNRGTSKFLKIKNDELSIDFEKISEEAQWDGLHGVITNIKDQSASEILEKYTGLWKIEEVFRINKNDLKMRPIYHWKPRRIRAHILICFLSYALLSYAKYYLTNKGIKISLRDIRDELSQRQISIMRDQKTNRKYSIPSGVTLLQREIYKALGVKLNESVQELKP